MIKFSLYLLILIFLASCEEQTEWDLQSGNNDFIVVNGILTNEFKIQTITLSKPVAGFNDAPQPVAGATVLVSTDQLTHAFVEDTLKPGTYLSKNPFLGIKNRTYSLLINSENKVYSSKAVLAPPLDFDLFQYQKNAKDSKYRFIKLPNSYSPIKPAMYEVLLDWSSAPGYENENPDSCKIKLYYYTLPTLDVSEVFAPDIEKVTFPFHTIITERRYSLTDEHAAFLRALLLETTWQGGFFNTANSNIPTNLSDGAKGFFGACGVVEKTETVK